LEKEGSVKELKNREDIERVVGTGGGSGNWGYINKRAGWADAEAGMRWLHAQVEATKRVIFLQGEAVSLLRTANKITGAMLKDSTTLEADLVILATGAWTGKLVDLRGRAQATGQVLAYLDITSQEQERLNDMPVLLSMTTGMFIIPPKNNLLKVARHAYGYLNPTDIPDPSNPKVTISVSLPMTSYDRPNLSPLPLPKEGKQACRQALQEMIPWLGDRPFCKSRICWYTDTPTGDFLITYHPELEGLFLATGGSGHGYKFLPVIGDKIVDCIQGQCPEEFLDKWAWPKAQHGSVVTEDGSRGGKPGLILASEILKGSEEVADFR
jgi:sarcosine oxidase/L-pipecolate oxidase